MCFHITVVENLCVPKKMISPQLPTLPILSLIFNVYTETMLPSGDIAIENGSTLIIAKKSPMPVLGKTCYKHAEASLSVSNVFECSTFFPCFNMKKSMVINYK